MPRPSKVESLAKPKPDLTPMIDIIFNLIIFFMIVSDFSNLEVEQLSLAYADQAQEPQVTDDRNLVINVKQPRLAIVRGEEVSLDPKLDHLYPALRKRLALEAAAADDPATEEADLEVTLRIDKDVPFEASQQALDACIRAEVFKTRFSATPSQD